MEIKINQEIKEYNETMFFGLSVRQFIFAILACASAVGIYFGCRSFMGTETLSWVCMLGAAPFAALGFIKYNGMTAEKIAKALYYYHTNDEIDEIGEGIIRKYNYQAFIQGDPTDIEGFIADHLNYRIVYDRLADKDAGRMAFLADGKDTMWVWRDGKRVEVIPPEGMIVIDEFLRQEKNKTRRRFVLAHEAGHIIMDLLNNKPVTAAYNNEFDCEQEYSLKDFAAMFNINENKATSMGVALLMPKTLVVNRVRAMIAPHKRIPLYGSSVLCDSDRAIISQVAEHFQVS